MFTPHLECGGFIFDRCDPLLDGVGAVGHREVTPLVTLGVERLGMEGGDLNGGMEARQRDQSLELHRAAKSSIHQTISLKQPAITNIIPALCTRFVPRTSSMHSSALTLCRILVKPVIFSPPGIC